MHQDSPVSTLQNTSFERKIGELQKKFLILDSPEKKYHFLIDLGRKVPLFDPKYKTEEYLVQGCQSKLFLHAEQKEGKIFFSFSTDALISAGLAALLAGVYSGETVETILNEPPHFLQTLGLISSLSPNRSQGMVYIYLKMKILARSFL